jgi:hypothetical protein
MPIREENKARYPKDWPEISRRIRFERAGNCCEVCGVPNYEMGGRKRDGTWRKALANAADEMPKAGEYAACEGNEELRIVRIVLTVAHLDHTPENCGDDNLKAMCQRCHNRYDMPMRRAGMVERAMRNQMALFGFSEEEAFPLPRAALGRG